MSSGRLHVLVVGGTFNLEGGRPSGYVAKFTQALVESMPYASVVGVNGGAYGLLEAMLLDLHSLTHLFWFADVPNDLPKLLPILHERFPALTLVTSKNNRAQKYTRSQLFDRMRAAGAECLVEFGNAPDGRVAASVLTVSQAILVDHSPDVAEAVGAVVRYLKALRELTAPLTKTGVITSDGDSHRGVNFVTQTQIPVGAHPGAFAVQRRFHTHEGIDLYGYPGEMVFAMEAGVVVAVLPFTGPAVGSPHWAPTFCVLVEGASGVLNYGELVPAEHLQAGTPVQAGEMLGSLATVLLEDKGRPMTMLHLERYVQGTTAPIVEWPLGGSQPKSLCDPTTLVVNAYRGSRD